MKNKRKIIITGSEGILGKEILRVISPDLEKKAVKKYLKIKDETINKINKW